MARKPQKINFFIPKDELIFEFFRSSGPGGQNVNKVSSGVRIRWKIDRNKELNEEEKFNFKKKYPNKFSKSGEFIVESKKYRSQQDNRNFAVEKLKKFIFASLKDKKRKINIVIPREKKEQRIKEKKKISEKKRLRKIHKEDFL